MSEVTVIISGKGRAGKATTSADVGTGLAILGKRVVLIDIDVGLRNLGVVVGLENHIVYNLVDVVGGNRRMKQALIRNKRYPNLYLLPSARARDKTSVNPKQTIKLVDDLKEELDYILLDCPAGIEQGFYNATASADGVLVVTTPEISTIRGANHIIDLLEHTKVDGIDLIVDRVRTDVVRGGDMMSLNDVTGILAVYIIGTVSDDESIVISTNQGEPLVGLGSTAEQAYLDICRRILGESIPITNPGETETFFTRLRGMLKKA